MQHTAAVSTRALLLASSHRPGSAERWQTRRDGRLGEIADWISDRLTVAVMQGILRRHLGRAEGASLGGFPVRRDGCCARAGAVLAAEEGRPGVGNSHHRQRFLGQPRHNLVVADGEAFSRSNEGHFPDPGAGDELLGDVDGDLSLGLEGVDGRAVATHDASDLVVKDVEALGEEGSAFRSHPAL